MKKLLYLFIAATILVSCSSDDDDINLDPIIGKWQQESILLNGMEQASDCEKKSTISFLENGTTTSVSFIDEGNGCKSETDSSTWVNIGNTTYKVGNDAEDVAVKLNFSENNTLFSATMTEEINGFTFTIIITFRKI